MWFILTNAGDQLTLEEWSNLAGQAIGVLFWCWVAGVVVVKLFSRKAKTS